MTAHAEEEGHRPLAVLMVVDESTMVEVATKGDTCSTKAPGTMKDLMLLAIVHLHLVDVTAPL